MIHFCTFGNIPQFSRSINELSREAELSKYFDTITIYTQENLLELKEHEAFIQSNKRGYGYWIWKPILLIDMFKKTAPGDIIIYSDAGCGISTSENAKAKFKEWIHDVTNIEPYRLSFVMSYLEKYYTKNDLFELMNLDDDTYKNLHHCIGGIQIYKNTSDNLNFIKEYYRIACLDNYHYITDESSRSKNDIKFIAHRHDQSILSLLFKKYGSHAYKDHWNNYDYPIVAIRRKY
jgi:hypothetical protein